MADDAFRPQKRQITDGEIGGEDNAQGAAEHLAEMAAMRSRAAQEVGEDFPDQGSPAGPANWGEGAPRVKGKIPEAFKQAVAGIDRPGKPTGRTAGKAQEMRVTGSGKLEELIAGIGARGSMVYEKVELPSRGKFYDGENGPADGVIHLRPMTGEEEEILATPRFVKKGQAINMIFNRCMKENFDASNFLTQDRTYMLIYLRGISYTPEYDVEVRDPETDQTFATTINLNDLFVDYCEADFGMDNLQDALPVTGYNFRYRLAVGRDEQEIQEHRERRAKNFDLSGQADDTLIYRTAHLIEEIEGLTDKREIQTLLKKLPIQDVAYLRTVVNEPPFGVDTKVSITNPYSLREFEIELPLESNFFFPRARKRTASTASRTQA